MTNTPFVTVLCPTYNEEQYIENILSFFVESKPGNKELYIIDGQSTDGTCGIVKAWAAKHENIHLLINTHKYVPYALNMGIKASKGDIIVRLDVHTEYATDYIEKIIETFNDTGADIVGGPMNPIGKTSVQKAIAHATSGSFGIGNSKFHNIHYKGYVDSVYLGAWKKDMFAKTGYFDEQMMRNQDDEFHYRAKSHGMKIYLNPEIKSAYYPRSSFGKLFKQYFQYGLYKPLVIKKNRSEVKLRHLIPLFFVLYLLSLSFVSFFPIVILPLILYVLIDLYCSFKNNLPLLVKIASLAIYPILHTSYGTGFLLGIFKSSK